MRNNLLPVLPTFYGYSFSKLTRVKGSVKNLSHNFIGQFFIWFTIHALTPLRGSRVIGRQAGCFCVSVFSFSSSAKCCISIYRRVPHLVPAI